MYDVRAVCMQAFMDALKWFEGTALARHASGPYLLGDSFSLLDIMTISSMERLAAGELGEECMGMDWPGMCDCAERHGWVWEGCMMELAGAQTCSARQKLALGFWGALRPMSMAVLLRKCFSKTRQTAGHHVTQQHEHANSRIACVFAQRVTKEGLKQSEHASFSLHCG